MYKQSCQSICHRRTIYHMHATKANRRIVLQSCKSPIPLQKTEMVWKLMNSWDSSLRITASVYSFSDQEDQWQIIKATPSILTIHCKLHCLSSMFHTSSSGGKKTKVKNNHTIFPWNMSLLSESISLLQGKKRKNTMKTSSILCS